MKLRRSPIFLFVLLFCPAYLAAADTTFPPCVAEQPGGWMSSIDTAPAVKGPADGAAVEAAPRAEPERAAETVDRERVAPALTPLAVPTPLARLQGDALFRQAYEDVYRILSKENRCSRFYGGAAQATYVFNQMAGRFKSARIGKGRVAGLMNGETMNVMHAPTGLKFRLFEKAVLNTEGAFYRWQDNQSGERVPRVGRFAPDTREARALILLHELGHVVKGKGGGWLLEDDGDDPSRSERNTEAVEQHCADQLLALGSQPAAPPPQSAQVAKSQARAAGVGDTPGQQ